MVSFMPLLLHAFAALPLWQDSLVPTGMVGPRIGLGTKKGENFAPAGNQTPSPKSPGL